VKGKRINMADNEKGGGVKYDANSDAVQIDDGGFEGEEKQESFVAAIKRMPVATWLILWLELCERFSYYGIKAVLILFLTDPKALGMTKGKGKAVYHAFSFLSYFTGLIGAMMADSLLGKFKTILWSLLFYCVAEAILTVFAVPTIGGNVAGALVGLFVMGIAGGNIKPCVGAFGGDQIAQTETGLITRFFALFYMSVNVGAMLTQFIMPVLRTAIQCFGGNCFAAIFGINTVILILGTVSFMVGGGIFNKKEPEGNMLIKVGGMMKHALSQKGTNKKNGNTYSHWLDNAQDKYSLTEINETKAMIRVSKMFIALPIFWALFSQQGSSWTLQAKQMDGDLGGGATIPADIIQSLNPVLVLIMIPLFDSVIYPCFSKIGFPLTPIRKMVGGMLLAAAAFAICGFMQIQIEKVGSPPLAPETAGRTSVQFLNVSPCERVVIDPEAFKNIVLPYGQRTSTFTEGQSGNRSFVIKGTNCYGKGKELENEVTVVMKPNVLENVYIDLDEDDKFIAKAVTHTFKKVNTKSSDAHVRVVYIPAPNMPTDITMTFIPKIDPKEGSITKNNTAFDSEYHNMRSDEYKITVADRMDASETYNVKLPGDMVKLGTFGSFSVILKRPQGSMNATELEGQFFVDIPAVSVHRTLQVPQYVVLTASEVMLSVTGLEFAYSQSPQSMKSVLQAIWTMTMGFGDLIVMIISLAGELDTTMAMFLYAGMMIIVSIIFSIQGWFYTYLDFSGKDDTKPPTPLDAVPEGEGAMSKCDSTSQL